MNSISEVQIQDQEKKRLEALASYHLLDILQEDDFDNLTKLTSALFQAPIVVITLIEQELIWLKSKVGLDFESINRKDTLCNYTILSGKYLEVPDAALEPTFQHYPFVNKEDGIRFYAGVPLINPHGYCLGTLCIYDYVPRQLTPDQRFTLETLAKQVMSRMELHLRERQLQEEKEKLARYGHQLENSLQEIDLMAYAVSHDMKAPLKAIHNLAEWVAEDLEGSAPSAVYQNLSLLQGRALRLEKLMDGLLNYTRVGRKKTKAEKVNTFAEVSALVQTLDPDRKTAINIAPDLPTLTTQKQELMQVFYQLIANAIQHNSSSNLHIHVGWKQEADQPLQFYVQDNGVGIEPAFQQKVFGLFRTIKARDEEENTGLGLAISRKILQNRGADLLLQSKAGEGSTFIFYWPE